MRASNQPLIKAKMPAGLQKRLKAASSALGQTTADFTAKAVKEWPDRHSPVTDADLRSLRFVQK